ncbi:hypothetical protein AB837_00168 [bacterium AB1]|nr:hypothetical protein AB837_00168 [bacterium AB1]
MNDNEELLQNSIDISNIKINSLNHILNSSYVKHLKLKDAVIFLISFLIFICFFIFHIHHIYKYKHYSNEVIKIYNKKPHTNKKIFNYISQIDKDKKESEYKKCLTFNNKTYYFYLLQLLLLIMIFSFSYYQYYYRLSFLYKYLLIKNFWEKNDSEEFNEIIQNILEQKINYNSLSMLVEDILYLNQQKESNEL